MIALIDGDMVIYMAAAGNQYNVDFGDGLGNAPLVNEKEAISSAVRKIEDWRKKAKCSSVILCLSEGQSFRYRLWPTYKSGRPPKPEAYYTVLEALKLEYETYREPGLEADDLMGIAGSSERAQTVIVSRDKDMKTVPGMVLNPDHDPGPIKIRRDMADQIWLQQTLMGDPVDKYPGVPGVGPVKANDIVLSPHRLRPPHNGKKQKWVKGEPCSVWQSMLDYAAKAGMTEEELIVQAQLSRILRSGEFDKERRVVKLWTPNGYKEMKLDE